MNFLDRLLLRIRPAKKHQHEKRHLSLEPLEDRCCPAGPLLIFHDIQTDTQGHIAPWFNPSPGVSYDHTLALVWNYWKNLPTDTQYGLPLYYSYRALTTTGADHDELGIGGDQFAMAIDSWLSYYAYTGDRSVLQNARNLADYYLAHSLAPANYAYANCPYPCNVANFGDTLIFDGDLVAGPGVLQPDKAGSFGEQLVKLYQVTGNNSYLSAAVNIANTLAATRNTSPDVNNSPWPFRVNADDGSQPVQDGLTTTYTTNWAPTLSLFQDLIALGQGDVTTYQTAFDSVLAWMLQYPTANHIWGPFGEDLPDYSDIQTNANTWAYYLLRNPSWDANWQTDVRGILDNVTDTFGDTTWNAIDWNQYGVTLIDEQTVYLVPGQSHTSRDASVELLYDYLTGNADNTPGAIRQLNWSTYMVAEGNAEAMDGASQYPTDAIWLTDGYGDYVRHYLRAMAADPALAASGQDHLLGTSSLVQTIDYEPGNITYTTADTDAQDVLRVSFVPDQVMEGTVALRKLDSIADLQGEDGYTFNAPGDAPGVLRIHHSASASVLIADPVTGPAAPSNVSASAVSSSEIDLTWQDNSGGGAQFIVDRSTDSGFTYNLVSRQSSTTELVDTDGLAPWTTYYYRVRAVADGNTSLNSKAASVQTLAGDLPSGFTDQDFGAPHVPGAASYDGSTWTIKGGGADMWNDVQEFNFASETVSGDQSMVAEVTGIQNTSPFAGAGVLFQDGTGATAAYANVFVTPEEGVMFQWRPSAGAPCLAVQVSDITASVWVKLVRSGDTFSAFYSTDGVNWTALGSPVTITFTNSNYLAGLAVTAHNEDAATTATFTNVSVSGP
jgi:hypothetical protein